MIKKSLILSLSVFILLFALTVLFQSCKCEQKVCNFTFNVSDAYEEDTLNRNINDGIDTSLKGIHFSFIAFNEANNPACAWESLGFSSAYATTIYCKVLNPIVANSYIVSLDRDISFNSTNIPAGTNLINYTAFKDHWTIDNVDEGARGSATIFGIVKLDTTLSNQIQFDTAKYNVTFGFSTSDGQDMRGNLDVIYKL